MVDLHTSKEPYNGDPIKALMPLADAAACLLDRPSPWLSLVRADRFGVAGSADNNQKSALKRHDSKL
jgi:hypothetical protein